MKITDLKATTVTVPLEAPLRHSAGCHWGRFVRTIVEISTDEGITGWGEMGGGGESASAVFEGMKRHLLGEDPMQLEALQWKLCNPTGSLYNNRNQEFAAIEFACLDIVGKKLGVRACDLLGGALREKIPFISYLFFRYANEDTDVGGESTPEEMVAHTRDLVDKCGFKTHKLKAGLFPPRHEIAVMEALHHAFPEDGLRIDANAVWSVETGLEVANALRGKNLEYLEDPCWGLEAARRLRALSHTPMATNMSVINFEQLASNVREPAFDVILLDTTFWGGLRNAWKAGVVCEKMQLNSAVHSSGELGIQLATMLHLTAVLPNLSYATDAHYHHLTDDILVGGKMAYVDGCIEVPSGPGLGVEVDRDKVARYAELYRELGGYPYDRDPGRPDWYALWPERNWAPVNFRKQ